MSRKIALVFGVVFTIFVITFAAGGWYVLSTLKAVESRLPLDDLDRQRELSGVIQTITQLAASLDAYRTEPTERRLEELSISLDRSYGISKSVSKDLNGEIEAKLGPVWIEINRILDRLDEVVLKPESADESKLLAHHTRVTDAINAFRDIYLESNMGALASLTVRMDEVSRLHSSAVITLLLIFLSVFAMGALLAWQRKTIDALTETESSLLQANKTIEHQYDELFKAARFKEEVERMARHDMKGALMGILNYPKMLLMSSDNLKKSQVETIKKIEDCGYRMRRMIDISLDLFRIEQGMYQLLPVPVDLDDTLATVISENRYNMEANNVSVDILTNSRNLQAGPESIIYGDEMLIYSMISNLFTNALEATPEGGVIDIGIQTGEEVSLSFHNNKAVPEDVRDCFFDKYATSGKSHGTGIGTYSAKLIAQIHGGTIDMVTGASVGTTVTVILPRSVVEKKAALSLE